MANQETDDNIRPLNEKEDKLEVGDRVVLDKAPRQKIGQIRFKGQIDKNDVRTWYGIRLTTPRGTCDGSHKGTKHFWCPDKFAIFVLSTRITGIYTGTDFDFMKEQKPISDRYQKHREGLKLIRAKFKGADTDGGGTLSQDEFIEFMIKEANVSEKEAKDLYGVIDVNKSGDVSLAEFDAYIKGLGGMDLFNKQDFIKIKKQFDKIDVNKDGKLSLDEFKSACRSAFGYMRNDDIEDIYRSIDTDNSGEIDYEEFDKWIESGGFSKIAPKKK